MGSAWQLQALRNAVAVTLACHGLSRVWCAGNAVDQIEADMVLLSTEAVHSKAVDANLLAEFVDCPGVRPAHLAE